MNHESPITLTNSVRSLFDRLGLFCKLSTIFLLILLPNGSLSQSSPATDPDAWLLSFLDVESTGLIPGFHEIVNVGIVLADLEGNELARLLLYIHPNHPERAAPEALAINGYEAEVWRQMGAVSPTVAVDSLIAFYKSSTGGKRVLMVAYNAQFDAAFMDHLFRDAGKSTREIHYYFVLDVPSMAWILGYRDLVANDIAKRFGIPGTSSIPIEHHGLGCADLNLRLYRELLKHSEKNGDEQ